MKPEIHQLYPPSTANPLFHHPPPHPVHSSHSKKHYDLKMWVADGAKRRQSWETTSLINLIHTSHCILAYLWHIMS